MDLQGVFVKTGGFITFEVFPLEFLEKRRSWENQSPQIAGKVVFLSLALYNAPSLHTVDFCSFFLMVLEGHPPNPEKIKVTPQVTFRESDAAFLLTVGSFLLTVELFTSSWQSELFYLQLELLCLQFLAFLLTVGAFLLTVGKCV